MTAPGRHAARPSGAADLDAYVDRLARRSRWASLLSLVGLLGVLAALVVGGRRLTALRDERAHLDADIESKRRDLQSLSDSLVRTREAFLAYSAEVAKSRPTLAAAAAQVARDSAAAAQVVFIQFRGQLPRALVEEMRGQLNAAGYHAPGVERVERSYDSSVRYFRASDAEAARRLAERVAAFFAGRGCPATFPVRNLSSRGASVPAGQLEVWIDLDCGGAPPAAGAAR